MFTHSPVCPCKAHQLTLGERSRYKEKEKRGKKPLGSAWALSLECFIGHVIVVESGHSLERQSHPVPSHSSKGFRNNTPNN